MSNRCDHDSFAFPPPGGIGIPRSGKFDGEAFEKAVNDLLLACGVTPESSHTGKTARRCFRDSDQLRMEFLRVVQGR